MDETDIIKRLDEIEAELAAIRRQVGQPVAEKPKKKRATPLPLDFEPSATDIARLKASYPNVDIQHETDKFRDYWAATGKAYLDWDAAFRNWIRKAAEFSKAPVARLPAGPQGRAASLGEDNRAKRDRALDKLAALQQRTAAGKV